MGIFSRFERRVEDGFDTMNDKLFDAPISPVQIAKKAEKQMRREKMVGAGKEFAPTLYTVLVNPDDDERLFGYYPTLAGETETYLRAKAAEEGLAMDGAPLVRFIVDDELKSGRFDIIAELVSAPIIAQLRREEMERYGLTPQQQALQQRQAAVQPAPQPMAAVPPIDAASNVRSSGIDVMVDAPEVYEDAPASVAEEVALPQTALFPEPGQPAPGASAPSNPHLINLNTGRAFDLAHVETLIGRGVNCDIVLDDLNASRMHAKIVREAPGLWDVSDMGSTNGTLVNGRHIAETTLAEGDRVTVGTTTFLFTFN